MPAEGLLENLRRPRVNNQYGRSKRVTPISQERLDPPESNDCSGSKVRHYGSIERALDFSLLWMKWSLSREVGSSLDKLSR